jgi:hypothetical protein
VIATETRAATKLRDKSGTVAAGKKNRRVEVFVPITSQSFFAQYDLRSKPDELIFGLPGNPDMTPPERDARANDVNELVDLLGKRVGRRATDARGGVTTPKAALSAADPRFAMAQRLSAMQIALYREYMPDLSSGISFPNLQVAFEEFANGELRSAHPVALDAGVGEPDSGFFFLFAEFAFLCVESNIDANVWAVALRTVVKTQEIFMHAYPHPAVIPAAPPPVGAPLPAACASCSFRDIDDFSHKRFASVGRSNDARKTALRAKYDKMNIDQLRKAAAENLLRAQRG